MIDAVLGSRRDANAMGGGGGGSGYVGGPGVSNAVTIAGEGQTPPAMTDYHYVPGVGIGGGRKGANENTPTYGGNGLVVIIAN